MQVKEFGLRMVVFSVTLSETALVCCQNVNEDEFCRSLYAPAPPHTVTTVSENHMSTLSTPAHPLRVEMRLGKLSVHQSFPNGMDFA